jgi:hypothetical protein
MAGGQQTYGDGGFSIAGLIEHLGREAARLNSSPGAAAFQSSPRPHQTPGALSASPAPQGARYGQLYAPPANDLSELRRQQAAFARKQHEIAWQNRWLAAPALAPVVAPFLAEGGAAALSRGLARAASTTEATPGPLYLTDHEALQRAIRQAYTTAEKNRLREQARLVFERANGISAKEMGADVHHSDPLQWAHLMPAADPNRLANLWALSPKDHNLATQQWRAFDRSLQGRTPSNAERMAAKLRIDRSVQGYVRRPGLSRWKIPPKDGGPT